MLSSGTAKTLGALVAALSAGTLLLWWMETIPAEPNVPLPLQALGPDAPSSRLRFIHRTEVPLQYIKWRNIVVHDAGQDGPKTVQRCHFLIGDGPERFGDGAIVATRLWRLQKSGGHTYVPGHSFDDESIGICLLGDCRKDEPSQRQIGALIYLVRALQATCQTPADRVYLHSELADPGCPGENFPARRFRRGLIPATR
jgi:hypothetical protein